MSEENVNLGEPTPEESTEPVNEQSDSENIDPETSAEEGESEEQEAETQEQENAEDEVEEDTDELPDEQQKVFPDEVLAKYAKRYGLTPEQLQENPSLKHLVQDKINSDILIQKQKQAEAETEEEPTPKEEPQAKEPTEQEREQQYQERGKALDEMAKQVTDTRMAKSFHKEFMGVWNEKDSDRQAEKFTHVMTKYGGNLIATILPHILYSKNPTTGLSQFEQAVDAFYPGMRDSWQQGIKASVWDDAKSGHKDLPAHGTPEFTAWFSAQSKRFPQVERMSFPGASPKEEARMKYETLIALATGQQTDPALAKKAVETGKKLKEDAQRRRTLGNSLGSGNSNKSFTPSQGDPLLAAISAHNDSQFIGNKKK